MADGDQLGAKENAGGAPAQEQFNAQDQRRGFLDKIRGWGKKDSNEPSPNSFEGQFQQNVRRYESLGGIIEAVTLKPENPKTEVPVVIAPGWSENKKVLKDTAAELFAAGRPVILLDHPRRGGKVDPREEYPVDELRKALTIKEITKQDNIDQIDIIAHSEGAINGAIAASLDPDRVRNMILVNPAGLIGKDTIPRLVGRFVKKNIQNFMSSLPEKSARKAFRTGQVEGGKYIASNPARGYQEVKAISQSEIDDMLKDLHDEGIGIVVVHGVDDPGFPMDRMQKIVKSDAQPDGFVDGFLSVRGGHDELYIHPEKYTGAAEKMLSALENKQSGLPERVRKPMQHEAPPTEVPKRLANGRIPTPDWGIEKRQAEKPSGSTRRFPKPSWGIENRKKS
jgi:pimeloyl-ACP methyl ester carboxylesterase